ncbi:hypothetical protein [Streptomyces sp. SID3343]|uniref:hypothetical protein n=1 Tax=Streptomyces sp. SID3343 TaxID=2690260 RepID=UPI00136FEEFB|nr:hypothetical protein [Streptomyces sp. SID3343]MYV97295.1 hypothetical protein [Streptomyces sp. SID3343]
MIPDITLHPDAHTVLTRLCAGAFDDPATAPRLIHAVAGGASPGGRTTRDRILATAAPLDRNPGTAHYRHARAVLDGERVWQCALNADTAGRVLLDSEWCWIAEQVASAADFGPNPSYGARWLAIRTHPAGIHIVAALPRQDGRPLDPGTVTHAAEHVARDIGERLWRQRMLEPLPEHHPAHHTDPASTVVLRRHAAGGVTAEGGDLFTGELLERAGFLHRSEGRWITRLDLAPTFEADQALHAARMLRATGYGVHLDPGVPSDDTRRPNGPANRYLAAHPRPAVTPRPTTDRGAAVPDASIADPEGGALDGLRHSLSTAGARCRDNLDGDRADTLAARLDAAAHHIDRALRELTDVTAPSSDPPTLPAVAARTRTTTGSGGKRPADPDLHGSPPCSAPVAAHPRRAR